jgi:hypothetical protein
MIFIVHGKIVFDVRVVRGFREIICADIVPVIANVTPDEGFRGILALARLQFHYFVRPFRLITGFRSLEFFAP